MVMGPTHSISGAAVFLAGATYLGAHTALFNTGNPNLVIMGTLVAAGAALAPDWDSPRATAVNSFGIVGRGIHTVVNGANVALYDATRTRYDRNIGGNGHRTFTHTTLAAVLAGVLVWLSTMIPAHFTFMGNTHPLVPFLIFAVFTHLGLAGLFEKQVKKARKNYGPYLLFGVSIAITLGLTYLLPEEDSYGWLGFAVGIGWFIHILGDMITKMGAPLLFPLKINGKRWWDVTLPVFMRIRAGGTFEYAVLLPALTLITAYLIFVNAPDMAESISTSLRH